MSNAAKTKKKAVELEQKKQLDKALALYIQFLQESDGTLDDADIPLYNRVGDLMLRTGNASDALNYYEKAVDLYADRGFLNNAIALCNKVLRQSPGRSSIYYKLGKISATKGFKSDAKKNFLEYADRMQKAGQMDEAFRALKEFADLCPDQDDIRLMLAEQLTKENRQSEALEQLQRLHDKLDSEGRTAEARATVDRMKSIDPDAVPRVSGSYARQKTNDLIFLDTSFEDAARSRPTVPAAEAPPSASRRMSDPDLIALTLGDQPAGSITPLPNVGGGVFALDIAPADDAPGSAAPEASDGSNVPLLDVADDLISLTVTPTSSAAEPPPLDLSAVGTVELEIAGDAVEPASRDPMDVTLETPGEPGPVDLAMEDHPGPEHSPDQPTYVPGDALGIDYVSDLAAGTGVGNDTGGDLFDFRAPPRSDDTPIGAAEDSALDPDVSFPSFDLGDMSLPSADEVTSGGDLAAALAAPLNVADEDTALDLPAGAPPAYTDGEETAPQTLETTEGESDGLLTDDLVAEALSAVGEPATPPVVAPAEEPHIDRAEESGATAVGELEILPADSASAEAAMRESSDMSQVSSSDVVEIASTIDGANSIIAAPAPTAPTPALTGAAAGDVSASDSESLSDISAGDQAATPESATPVAMGTPDGLPTERAARDAPQEAVATSTAESSATDYEERLAGWEVQRAHAERLLESGDRGAGIRELEHVAAELERIGDLERAQTIVDELIRLTPDSIRHHQKRVELAFRSNDRLRLIDAYLELGDALFRAGEELKARAVYQRVLELAPDDARARAALDSVKSMSPAAGTGTVGANGSSPSGTSERSHAPPQRAGRDTHIAYHSTGSHGAPHGNGHSAGPRKPAPLDRGAPAEGEFVDLGEWLRAGDNPKSTRMIAEEQVPSGDEQADFQEMLKRFKQGVSENVEADDYESHYDLGVAYKEMGLIEEAVAEFQKALRGTTHRVRAYEALGQCFVEKEQYQVAASVLSRAIALGEGDDHHLVGVLYLLGLATEALNKHTQALDYYQRVFAVDIEFRDVAERISAIERKVT